MATTTALQVAFSDGRRSPHPVRRQRRLAGAGAAADQSLAGERLRVRADVGHACRARPPVRRRPAGIRRIRAPRGSPVAAGDGRVPGPAHRRGRSGQAAHRRAGRRDLGRAVRRGGTSGADRERDRRHRRSRDPAPARRAAQVVGARPRPRQVPRDGPARDRRRGGGHDRGRRTRRHSRGLPGLLRRRPLRRVDALCPQVSRGAARACRAAAADRDAGHDHQRPPRPRGAARQRRVPRRTAAQQPPRDHRCRPLRLGGGAGGVRLDHPRLDRGQRLDDPRGGDHPQQRPRRCSSRPRASSSRTAASGARPSGRS